MSAVFSHAYLSVPTVVVKAKIPKSVSSMLLPLTRNVLGLDVSMSDILNMEIFKRDGQALKITLGNW